MWHHPDSMEYFLQPPIRIIRLIVTPWQVSTMAISMVAALPCVGFALPDLHTRDASVLHVCVFLTSGNSQLALRTKL